MGQQFAIGCMRGGMWASGISAILSFIVFTQSGNPEFVWLALFLWVMIAPIWLMKRNLEK